MMNNHPKLFVLILIIILFIIIFVLYRIADKYLNYSSITSESLSAYVGDKKYEFDADITINKKGVISNIEPSININFSSTPILGDNKIIFPKDMIIIFADDNYAEYRLIPYSYISDNNLITKNYNKEASNYFLYDSEDTYLFGNSGVLTVDDTTINLSKYSYLICTSKSVTYYDYENDTTNEIEYTDKVTFKADTYLVNVSEDTFGSNGNILPNSFNYIDLISKYDD
jgi:hypothetical protein